MKLYCIGDSLTFGYGVSRSHCWVRQLEQRGKIKTVNLGINGNTTSDMRHRLESMVLPLLQSEREEAAVLLMGGFNDVFFSGSDALARENMTSMLKSLSSVDSLVLVLIPPRLGTAGFPLEWELTVDFLRSRQIMEEYSCWLISACAANKVPCLDLRKVVDSPDYLLDGIHPNEAAQFLIADAIWGKLQGLFGNQIPSSMPKT